MNQGDIVHLAQLDAVAGLLDGGAIQLYGSPAMADADLLAEVSLADPAARPAENDRAAFYPVRQVVSAGRFGRARWYRCVTKAGLTVFDGPVGPVGPGGVEVKPAILYPGCIVAVSKLELIIG